MGRAQNSAASVLAKIDKGAGCWVWTGSCLPSGYGKVTVNFKTKLVHRVVYEELVGEIPAGLQLDHICENKSCANPSHLAPSTARTNTLRSNNPTAINFRKKACIRGHALSGENLYMTPDGRRQCRECRKKAAVGYPNNPSVH